ncbi:hypothetical protein [Motilimonas pumila]|uniref:Uncharacterized protein n=1 Tax=Motilimonas pumila TaxID=2303987 RepID=A0A418Y9B7_9GAMM|nr:hypothetical protein [Motilimonas pumila]RJG36918.1 hypothetical protein D1Z90_20100 [Motilimonas pumila]
MPLIECRLKCLLNCKALPMALVYTTALRSNRYSLAHQYARRNRTTVHSPHSDELQGNIRVKPLPIEHASNVSNEVA